MRLAQLGFGNTGFSTSHLATDGACLPGVGLFRLGVGFGGHSKRQGTAAATLSIMS